MADIEVQCYLTRTTLYRYRKGLTPIPPNAEANISKALRMNQKEKEEFRKLIVATVQDGSLISSRYVLDDLIFTHKENKKREKGIDFVLHNKERLLHNTYELTKDFLKHSKREMFQCDIKVINCINEEFQAEMQYMLTQLLMASANVEVEYLIVFPKKDYLTCTRNFLAVLPMLHFHKYNVFYNDCPTESSETSFFDDIIIVETSWHKGSHKKRQYFVLSFLTEGRSQCVAFEEEYHFRFYMENYQDHRSKYRNALLGEKSVPDITEVLLELELATERVVLKPDPCYYKIPIQVYDSILERIPLEKKQEMQIDTQEGVERTRLSLETRFNHAYKTGNIHVMSKAGLSRFAQKGMLADHIQGLPPFNEEERKIILLSIQEHIRKKSGGYQLYITKDDIRYILAAYKNNCVVIEFLHSQTKHHQGYPFVLIENKILVEVFFDYANNHIPAHHALSEKDAVQFLDDLIEMVGKIP